MVATKAKTATQSLKDSGTTADTYGWDTVFAITYTDVNKAIVKAKSSPPSFNQSTSGWTPSTLSGNFGDWQVILDGDGKDLHMALPLNQATFTMGDNSYGPFSGTANIEVQLAYLPQPTQGLQDANTGQNQLLKVNDSSSGNTDPVVSVLGVVNLDPAPPDTNIPGYIQGVLQTWLNANLQSFNHVFAVVDINAVADQGCFQWLKPTYTSYACTDLGSMDKSVFGVLSMTENRPADSLAHQISANAIPSGANAGLLISNERFASKMLLAGMPNMCRGASASDFQVAADGSQIVNLNKLSFQSFTTQSGQSTTPTLDTSNFLITINDSDMVLSFTNFTYDFAAGVTLGVNYVAHAQVLLDSNNHFLIQQTKSTTSGSVAVASWLHWTEFAVGIAASVLGGVAGGWLGEAVDGAGTVVDEGGSTTISEITTNSPDLSPGNTIDSLAQDGNEGASEIKTSEPNSPDEPANQKGWFARNWKKICFSTLGGIMGQQLGDIANYLSWAASNDMSKVPTLDQWTGELAKPTIWPDSNGEYALQSATLNGSLQLGIQVTFDH